MIISLQKYQLNLYILLRNQFRILMMSMHNNLRNFRSRSQQKINLLLLIRARHKKMELVIIMDQKLVMNLQDFQRIKLLFKVLNSIQMILNLLIKKQILRVNQRQNKKLVKNNRKKLKLLSKLLIKRNKRNPRRKRKKNRKINQRVRTKRKKLQLNKINLCRNSSNFYEEIYFK